MGLTHRFLLLFCLWLLISAAQAENSGRGGEILLITGGNSRYCEVMSLADRPISCNVSVPNMPIDVVEDYEVSFLHHNDPVFSSGYTNYGWSRYVPFYKYSLDTNTWQEYHNLTQERYESTKLRIEDYILITGGRDEHIEVTNTTALWNSGNGTFTDGPDMPYASVGHCFATINSSSAILMGGLDDSWESKDMEPFQHVYLFQKETEDWTRLQSMEVGRHSLACGLAGTSRVVAAGGLTTSNFTSLSSVEICDLDTQTWAKGPDLPHDIAYATSVQLQDTFLIVGGYSKELDSELDTVYEYDMENNAWILWREKMYVARTSVPAVWRLPASCLQCE